MTQPDHVITTAEGPEVTLLELRFPDGTISRYPSDKLKELLSQGRVQANWMARRPSEELWSTVELCLLSRPNGLSSPTTVSTSNEAEEIVASIGQRSIVGFLKREGIASTQVVLTKQRIYGKGRTLALSTSSKTRIVGDLTKLSSIGIEHQSKWRLLVIGVILIACHIGSLVVLNNMDRYLSRQLGPYLFLSPLFLIGSWLVTSYFISRRRLLVLNFSGHIYQFSMSGIPEEIVEQFVDKVIKALNNRTHPRE